MSRVIHFEIQADKPQRAMEFYTKLFGWKFDKWPGPQEYWLITTGPNDKPGINGGLLPRRAPNVGDALTAYVCTIATLSVDECVAKAVSSGGQNVVPKMAIPGVGWLAYCKDTEGNIFGVMHDDPSAK